MKAATSNMAGTAHFNNNKNKKRPSPLNRSPASTAGSVASSITSRRRIESPSSPLDHRILPDCPSSSFSSSSVASSSSSSGHRDLQQRQLEQQRLPAATAAAAGMPAAWTKEQKQKRAALESQMKSLFELEYREEVLQYMYEMEGQTMASVELIDMQPELAWYMRPYLVDFLIEIHQQYRLRPETLYLALNIVDRYVSKRIVYKKHYQLVGCAALWIASKFEDAKDRVPTVEDLCAVCCSAYDQSAFIQMEGHVLSTIGWCLGHPTAEAWLRIACAEGPTVPMEDPRTQHVARFVMEITLFHRAFVSIKPSDIALSCLLLARFMCDPEKARRSNERPEIVKIAQMLDAHLAEHLEQVSATVVKKYSPSFYSRASVYVREWYLSGRRFNFSQLLASSSTSASTVSASAPEVDMVTSSPTSSSSGSANGDSDFDEDEDVYSSQPITPSTSVASSACGDFSSDPFDSASVQHHQAQPLSRQTAYPSRNSNILPQELTTKSLPVASRHLPVPTPAMAAATAGVPTPTAAGMQWHMQVVPPSAEH